MKTGLLLAVVSAAFAVGVHGQAAPKGKGKKLPEGVRVLRDLEYAKPGGKPLLLDLYLPEKPSAAALPVVVWVHGGGWNKGSKDNCPAAWLAGDGFAVASINYRLSTEGPWPAQIDDCHAAVRWLREHAGEYKIDGGHVGAWGGSAGGHLVAIMGTRNPSDAAEAVQAVCDWYGPADLLTMPNNVPSEKRSPDALAKSNGAILLGAAVKDVPDKAKDASAIYHVSADDPPFLIMHGDEDPQVPIEQSRRFYQTLKSAGVPVTLEVVKGGGHGGPAFQTEQVKGTVKAFFEKTLRPPEANSRGSR